MSTFQNARGGWVAKYTLRGRQYWVQGGPWQTKELADAAERRHRQRVKAGYAPREVGIHTVYRLYSGPELIYVGITGKGMRRLGDHRRSKGWWKEVTRAEFEHFEKGGAAEVRELELIQRHEPRYNARGLPHVAQATEEKIGSPEVESLERAT